jgi:hypothetical protein
MQDSRLWGIWRSDARRTAREIAARKDIGASSRLKKLFGRLELKYTRTRCYATFDGHMEVLRYKVVAKDSNSVVIVSEPPADSPLGGDPVLTHIHFEGPHYWINLPAGPLREFFRRRTKT